MIIRFLSLTVVATTSAFVFASCGTDGAGKAAGAAGGMAGNIPAVKAARAANDVRKGGSVKDAALNTAKPAGTEAALKAAE